jgi:hypothetical protein
LSLWYKILGWDGAAIHGAGKWNLPEGDQPGAPMPRVGGPLEPCVNGYHFTDASHLIYWLGPRIFILEPLGEIVAPTHPDGANKWITDQARLLRETAWTLDTARRFCQDCYEHTKRRHDAFQVSLRDKLDNILACIPDRYFDYSMAYRYFEFFSALDSIDPSEDAKLWRTQRLLAYVHGSAVL